jgi:alpha-1,6-mannosyltransferase
LRWLGVLGSVALAAGAVRAGARPGGAATDDLPDLTQLPWVALCLLGLVTLTVAWWRLGRDRPGTPPSTARWLLVTAALWALPMLLAPPLASRDVYAYACQGAVVVAGADPAAMTPAGLPCRWLDSVPPIWRDSPSPYGPLAAATSAGAVWLGGGQLTVVVALLRVVAVAGVLLAIWYGRRLAAACAVDPARAAWLALCSPLVAVHAMSGAHHDALMTGLVVAGFAMAASRRALLAGALLGGAVAVKITALVALPFVVLALGGRAPVRAVLRRAAVVAVPAVVVYLALAALTGTGVGLLRALGRTGDLVQWTSPPTAVGMTLGYAWRAAGVDGGYRVAVDVVRLLALAALVGVVVWLWWRAWRSPVAGPGVAVFHGGLAFTAVVLLGPVFFPWYVLTPVALLAVSTMDDRVRRWISRAVAVLPFVILPNGAGLAPRTKLPGALAVTAALTAGAVAAVRGRRRQKPSA